LYARHSEQYAQDKVLEGITVKSWQEYEGVSALLATTVGAAKDVCLLKSQMKKFKEDDLIQIGPCLAGNTAWVD
jgi:hypothetical protein